MKYSRSKISGTGYLAFKDIQGFISTYNIDMSNVLDYGCGHGRSTIFLTQLARKIKGCDIDYKAINYCRLNITEIDFFIVNSETMKQNNSFTAIFSFFVVFHIRTIDELLNYLDIAYNCLNKNGTLLVINGTKYLYEKKYVSVKGLSSPENDGDRAKILLKNIDLVVEDTYWSETMLKNLALKVGFSQCDFEYPLISQDDSVYLDEKVFPPYYIGVLKK